MTAGRDGRGADADAEASLRADLTDALTGADDLVAAGFGPSLLPALLAARRATDGGTWRLLCPAGVVDDLGRALPLGSALAEACEATAGDDAEPSPAANGADPPPSAGGIDLRTGTADRDEGAPASVPPASRVVVAAGDAVHAVVGPEGDRVLLTETDPERVERVRGSLVDAFDRGEPASVRMPSRTRLVAGAREALGDRFADDLAPVLETLSPGDLDRSRALDDRVLLVALAARHDHLFADLRAWGGEVGVAPPQTFTRARRALADRGLIETFRVPLGDGRPQRRLRAVDDGLLKRPAEELVDHLRERFAEGRVPADDD